MSIYQASSKNIALKHPFSGFAFMMGNKNPLHKAIILKSATYLFGDKYLRSEWKQALEEISNNDFVPQNPNPGNILVGNNLNTTFGKWIYCCVRVLKPEHMIETGVAHGASSWIILNAMHKNGKGTLHSIDLPDNDTNAAYNFKSGPKTGWIVPESLRPRWDLQLGKAQDILPALLNCLEKIDIFFHDSDHSYSHMRYEFETVFPFLNEDGVILSDDVHKNNAFPEFIAKHFLKALQFNKGGCAKRI